LPNWLVTEGAIFIFWLIFAVVVYAVRGWQIGFPFSKVDARRIIAKLVAMAWVITTLIFGVVYFVVWFPNTRFIEAFCALIVIPLLVLISLAISAWYTYRRVEQQRQQDRNLVSQTKAQCNAWVDQFSFLGERNVELHISTSNGVPAGRIFIHAVTSEQATKLRSHASSLPDGVTLSIIGH
jgi:hypothetical protein